MNLQAAYDAATNAAHEHATCEKDDLAGHLARVAVTAALPLIREQIAQALDSEGHHWSGGQAHAYFHAADIARGETR